MRLAGADATRVLRMHGAIYHGRHGQKQTANSAPRLSSASLDACPAPSAELVARAPWRATFHRSARYRERHASWRTRCVFREWYTLRGARVGCDGGLRRSWKGGEVRWKDACSA